MAKKSRTQAIVRAKERVKAAALVQDAASGAMRNPGLKLAAPAGRSRVLPGTTPLVNVVDRYLEDVRGKLKRTTFQPRQSHLNVLVELMQQVANENARKAKRPSRPLTLADLITENVQPIIDGLAKTQLYNARGKAIAARAVGSWLAQKGLWYVGDQRIPLSVLYQLEIPEDRKTGRPVYEEHELQTIRDAASSHPTRPHLHLAAQRMHELGIRAGFEAMTVRLGDMHLARQRGEVSYLVIREDNTKTDAGAREVPIEATAAVTFKAYLEMERPDYKGAKPSEQTFFLNVHGLPFTYGGWNTLLHRFKRHVERLDPTIDYKASRNRGTRTKQLRKKLEDSEIMQVMGWDSPTMINRYAGRIPTEEIAQKLIA